MNSIESRVPNIWRTSSFFVRSHGLKARRLLKDYSQPVSSLTRSTGLFPVVISQSITLLRYVQRPAERVFEEGKIQNLTVACRHLNGTVLEPGQIFSFWKKVGPPWKSRGFVVGREIREGCLVPTIGGGLCQISGALYFAAKNSGLKIIERHAHSRRLQDAYFDESRDATLYWNYVDLRFAADFKVQIEAFLTDHYLVIRMRAQEPIALPAFVPEESTERMELLPASDCLSCGHQECSQSQKTWKLQRPARQIVLSDRVSQEFALFLQGELREKDVVFTPDRRRSGIGQKGRSQYAVPVNLKTFPWAALKRSFVSRFGSRQEVSAWVRMAGARILADAYADEISKTNCDHLFIDQEILPFLWKKGFLAEKSFSVLASRLPIYLVQQRLEKLRGMYPDRKSLVEFRADEELVAAEIEALHAAKRIISAHGEVARLIPRCEKINWLSPDISNLKLHREERNLYLFPGKTAARDGAYEVREAARQLGLHLAIFKKNIEHPDFWKGIETVKCSPDAIPWSRVAAILHPACFLAHPRTHLKALALGIPVFASAGCGLPVEKVIEVEAGSSQGLILKIKKSAILPA